VATPRRFLHMAAARRKGPTGFFLKFFSTTPAESGNRQQAHSARVAQRVNSHKLELGAPSRVSERSSVFVHHFFRRTPVFFLLRTK
jgi:hypothetical protein